MIGALLSTYHPPMRVCDSADFVSAENDRLFRTANLTGAADGKKGIFSAWVRIDSAGSVIAAFDNGGPSVGLRWGGDGFGLTLLNAGVSAVRLNITTSAAYPVGATWRHVLASFDVGTALARHLYVNDVSDLIVGTFTDDTLDLTAANWNIGGNPGAGIGSWNGCLAEVYINLAEYLDFSLVANRRKFISASGKPVHLGDDGSLPTGTPPIMYFHIDNAEAVANFALNRGAAEDFSIGGTLDTGSSSPSD